MNLFECGFLNEGKKKKKYIYIYICDFRCTIVWSSQMNADTYIPKPSDPITTGDKISG